MNSVIAWFVRNHVAANLLMALILLGGYFTLPDVRKEIFPVLELDQVLVTVPYPGATAEEVESAIIQRIEEAVQGIEGIKELTAKGYEGGGSVTIEVDTGYDVGEMLDEVKSKVDAIVAFFPADAERPIYTQARYMNRTISVAVSGDVDEHTLKAVTEKVQDDLLKLPDVTQATLSSVRPFEISIEVPEAQLRRYGLSLADIATAIRTESLDLPAGTLRTRAGDVVLRTQSQAYSAEDYGRLVIIRTADGHSVHLGDIAQIDDGFSEDVRYAYFDGKPAAFVNVYRVGDQSLLDVVEQVKDYVAAAEEHVPQGVHLTIWQDDSIVYKGRMDILTKNAVMALVLVYIVLMLFLRPSLAFWVSLGIPVSFLGTLFVMPMLDMSLNMVSMFAFILVLGIVVDDAIVVGESTFARQVEGHHGELGAIAGAQMMAKPVIFAVLTTIAAFAPILFLPGTDGQIWSVIAIIVIVALTFSLIESLFILPAHLALIKGNPAKVANNPLSRFFAALQQRVDGRLQAFIQRIYLPLLEWSLRWRYTMLMAFFGVFIVAVVLVQSGWLRTLFFPRVPWDTVTVTLTLNEGARVEETEQLIRRIQNGLLDLDAQYRQQGTPLVRHYMTLIGEQTRGGDRTSSGSGEHLAELTVELTPAEQLNVAVEAIVRQWRERVGPMPQVRELDFNYTRGRGTEEVTLQLASTRLDDLYRATRQLREAVSEYEGVAEITDSYETGREEYKLHLKPVAQTLGLTLADVSSQVRHAIYGFEAQRIQRGRDEVKVMVRLSDDERDSVADIQQLYIQTPAGLRVPFVEVATLEYGQSLPVINRIDRQRVITFTAKLDPAKASVNEVMARLQSNGVLKQLEQQYPGLSITPFGSQKRRGEIAEALKHNFLIALIVIYALMAIPFSSYTQPMIVMLAIPFGFVGAVIGHMALGLTFSMLSLIGIVATAGVVVNDSLVLMDYINRKRHDYADIHEAVIEAGKVRFRPIILTSLTTFFGLMPLIMEKSVQAQFLIPMGVSVAFGVMFATFITLLLVPISYMILEDVHHKGAKIMRWLRS